MALETRVSTKALSVGVNVHKYVYRPNVMDWNHVIFDYTSINKIALAYMIW